LHLIFVGPALSFRTWWNVVGWCVGLLRQFGFVAHLWFREFLLLLHLLFREVHFLLKLLLLLLRELHSWLPKLCLSRLRRFPLLLLPQRLLVFLKFYFLLLKSFGSFCINC
jgi:hypothetical protein